jgi:hypothetical protein
MMMLICGANYGDSFGELADYRKTSWTLQRSQRYSEHSSWDVGQHPRSLQVAQRRKEIAYDHYRIQVESLGFEWDCLAPSGKSV